MKKNYIAPANTTYNVVEQKVIAVSFNISGSKKVDDTTLDVKEDNSWSIWED